ncbi:MAG: hypothetical protein ACXVBH_01210 [Flavisolibacter sp.]
MKLLFAFLLGITGAIAKQDSWKVCLDKKVLLQTSKEDEQKNVFTITSADLKKSKKLELSYTQVASDKGWERTVSIYDANDQELKTVKGNKLSLKNSELRSLLEQHKTIKFYTLYSPTDPKMKAMVRLRRVHLCTLVLQ